MGFLGAFRTKQLGIVLKLFVILLLPVPLLLYPAIAAVGSIMVGLGYGIGQPLVATFEAVGEGRTHKFYHAIVVSDMQLNLLWFQSLKKQGVRGVLMILNWLSYGRLLCGSKIA